MQWLEFQDANAKENMMSMPETIAAGATQEDCRDKETPIHISFAVKTQRTRQSNGSWYLRNG